MVKNIEVFQLNRFSGESDTYLCFKWVKANLALGNPVSVVIRKDKAAPQSFLYKYLQQSLPERSQLAKLNILRGDLEKEAQSFIKEGKYFEAAKLFGRLFKEGMAVGQSIISAKLEESKCLLMCGNRQGAIECLQAAENSLGISTPAQHKYSIYKNLAELFAEQKQYSSSNEYYQKAYDSTRLFAAEERIKLESTALFELGLSETHIHEKVNSGLEKIDDSIQLSILYHEDPKKIMGRLVRKGHFLIGRKMNEEAAKVYTHLIDIAVKEGVHEGQLWEYYYLKGMSLRFIHKYAQSYEAMLQAYTLVRDTQDLSTSISPDQQLNIKSCLAEYYLQSRNFDEAIAVLREVYDRILERKQQFGKKELLVCNLIGKAYYGSKNYQEASLVFQFAETRLHATFFKKEEQSSLLNNLGMCYVYLKQFKLASSKFGKALQLIEGMQNLQNLRKNIADNIEWQICMNKQNQPV